LEVAMSSYLKKCRLSDLVKTEPEMQQWLNQSAAVPAEKR
jgi:hypothetical protein